MLFSSIFCFTYFALPASHFSCFSFSFFFDLLIPTVFVSFSEILKKLCWISKVMFYPFLPGDARSFLKIFKLSRQVWKNGFLLLLVIKSHWLWACQSDEWKAGICKNSLKKPMFPPSGDDIHSEMGTEQKKCLAWIFCSSPVRWKHPQIGNNYLPSSATGLWFWLLYSVEGTPSWCWRRTKRGPFLQFKKTSVLT